MCCDASKYGLCWGKCGVYRRCSVHAVARTIMYVAWPRYLNIYSGYSCTVIGVCM